MSNYSETRTREPLGALVEVGVEFYSPIFNFRLNLFFFFIIGIFSRCDGGKIIINLLRTYKKLTCKEEPDQFSRLHDPLDRHTF